MVSAMAGKTNELVAWCTRGLRRCTIAREYDAVVASGEQVTSGLLAIVLQEMGVHGPLLAGLADPDPDRRTRMARPASPTSTARRCASASARARSRSIAGFQGIAPDTAASPRSAAAARTPAPWRSPRRSRPTAATSTPTSTASTPPTRASSPKARRLDKIAFEEMLEMASLGAKVLQVRSVELAMVHKVRTYRALVLRRPGGNAAGRRHPHLRRGGDRGTAGRHRHRLFQGRGPDHAAPRRRPARRRGGDLRAARRGQHQCRHDRPEHLRGRRHDRHDLHRAGGRFRARRRRSSRRSATRSATPSSRARPTSSRSR